MQQNGFDLEQYGALVSEFQQQPEAAKLAFSSRFEWDGGFAGDASAVSLEQHSQTMPRPFVFRCDVPHELVGGDSGSMPGERLLTALSHCVGTAYAVQATKRGIAVQGIEVELEGHIDLRGFLELDAVRPGLSGITATVRVRSNADDATLRQLADAAARTSPIYDSLVNPVPIELHVERAS